MINFSVEQKRQLCANLGSLLIERECTVTSVESCTGGGLAFAITEVAGSSQWFNQSFVTYSNHAKSSLVEVSQETLDKYGAVSEQTVQSMAIGGLRKAKADYCVSISGIAGPSGGSKEKPVGLVWFAIACPNKRVLSFSRRFSGDRSMVREQAIVLALEKLIECIVSA